MLAIAGIYDGTTFRPLEEVPHGRPYKVIITFVEELGEEADIRAFAAQTEGLAFWEDEREDLYQDYLTPPQK